jgi:tetratricopeptide (TPR) repeat protein
MNPPKKNKPTVSELLQNGMAHHQLGRLQEAEAIYLSILKEQPQQPDALHLMGVIAAQVGKHDIAVGLIESAIKINPNVPDFYNNCGEAYRALHKTDLAISHYEQAIAIKPDFAEPHNNLGIALQGLGRQEDAITHFEQALVIKPDYAEAHNNQGNSLRELGRPDDAVTHFQQSLAIRPDFAQAHNNLGNVLQELLRQEDAISHYEQALAIMPDFTEAHNNLGAALQELGRKEEAISHYEQALAIKPDYAEAHRNLSIIKPGQEQVSIIEQLLKGPPVSEKDVMHYHYSLGNIFDDAKSFDKAFEHYLKANTLKRNTITYNPRKHSVFVDSLIKVYSKSYFQEKYVAGSDSELPVFIVGMPRSGTSLIEQIVASHPQVYGAGELSSIWRIEQAISKQFETSGPYPECMSLCDDAIAVQLSAQHLNEICKYSQDATRITDKLPDNFLRIGLIKTLFPKARIIHCQRNAMDTCSSIFLNYFDKGNEYSFDLTELGQYYLDYVRLMAHWRSLFAVEIFELQYEEIVMDQEKVSRQLVAYLGLEWDKKCLGFYKNKRAVRTTSNFQVRKPIYTKSINRWKQYEKHLGPLMETLQHLN